MHRAALIYLLCLLMVGFAVAMSGCPSQPETETVDLPPEGVVEPPPAETEGAALTSDFEWTATPTVDMIPSGQISGMLNGEPFVAETVRIEKDEEGVLELNISNTAVDGDDPTDMITGDDAWQLTFSGTEGETGEWTWTVEEEKDFDTEHVYYYYARGEEGPMSINSPWGGALQITEWTVQEPEEGAETFHTVLGNVKGKVLLVMDDEAKSWVGGEFDAVYYEF